MKFKNWGAAYRGDLFDVIDFRHIMENVEFLLLWKENKKSGNGLFFLSWKVMTFHIFLFHVHGSFQE